jgi:Zn-dependent peptidase ImmA (M78 family)
MYERLLNEAQKQRIEVVEFFFRGRIKGLYCNNVIGINRNSTTVEKACILAEELGHYHTSVGDILDQTHLLNCKQENRARRWGYEKLVPLDKLIAAHNSGFETIYEIADALEVTESFLSGALQHYIAKHGSHRRIQEYVVYFEPLRVFKLI